MYVLHHLRVDKTQTLLLATTNQQGTMDLDAVDIDGVLVKRTAADVILAAQLVRLAHARISDQQALYRSSGCVRHDARCGSVDAVHRTLRMLDATHLNLCQHLLIRQHLYVDVEYLFEVDDTLLNRGITDHREGQYHRVRFLQEQLVVTVLVRRRSA